MAVTAAIGLCETARAAVVQETFNGTVEGWTGPAAVLQWQSAVGIIEAEPASMTLTYDTNNFVYDGQYNSLTSQWVGPATLSIQIGTQTFTAAPAEVFVGPGQLGFYFTSALPPPDPTFAGACADYHVGCFELQFYGFSPPLDDSTLPDSITSFQYGELEFLNASNLLYANEGFGIYFGPESISTTPLPAGLPLFLAGLSVLGLVVLGRNRPLVGAPDRVPARV